MEYLSTVFSLLLEPPKSAPHPGLFSPMQAFGTNKKLSID
jgi:hypothetical protein